VLYRDKPIKDVVAMQIPKNDLLSITKVNAYIGSVSELFKWAIRNGYTHLNPFTGIKLKEKVADHEKRIPFDKSDLKAIFSTPIFQQSKHLHPYYYWLPLLGLFTGARIDELCQLYLEDIYQKEELWVIDFNEKDDKKLKNEPSVRVIPIHSRLIELGLIDYCAKLRKNGQVRLFPELKKERDGYSQTASKWFSRYRISCGVTHKRKAYHSFRHTVDNDLKQRKEIVSIIAGILGHKDDNMTTGLYGMKYEPSTLVSAVESLSFQIEVAKFQ
jgi:integrase